MITIASSIIFLISGELLFPGLNGVHPLGDDLYTVIDDHDIMMLWYSPNCKSKVPGSGVQIFPRIEDSYSIRLEKIERAGKYLVGTGTWKNGDSVFCYVNSNVIALDKVFDPDDVHYTSSRDSLMMCISR